MAIFRSLDAITLALRDFLRTVQPDLDTKPGSVGSELFVDAPASELAKLYIELRNISNLQSFSSARGTDLDKLARNFGLIRGSGTNATGVVVFTAAALESDISIPANTVVTARNGFTFRTLATTTMSAASKNVFKANAIRLRTDLDLAGISDQYAVEVAAEATSPGAGGNIAKFGIVTHNVPGISNATNLQSFTGGASSETDDAFRSRVLSVFAGSNTGTALGYINALLKDTRVQDVLTVEPGDPLMTRDGTDVITSSTGVKTIIASGTGGKVDLYIKGTAQEQFVESSIYHDQSGKNDPTDPRNDFVLGQRGLSTLLDFQQRRRTAIKNGTIPIQPVDEIISVTGSLSGSNFTQATTDAAGNKTGSFELIKDTGAFGNSPFGFDKLHFISSTIPLPDETINKGPLNSQDPLDFTDVQSIDKIRQQISINNESPVVSSSDRSMLTITHTPIASVDRVFNITTGERYSILNSNPNGTEGEENSTGVIQISGNTLPTLTDILQVNYIWDTVYDSNLDYDNLVKVDDFRTVQDSVDWGFSNRLIREAQTVLFSSSDGYHVLSNLPATKVINVSTLTTETAVASGGKLITSSPIVNIVDVKNASKLEVYNTTAGNGSFTGSEITLPTDSLLANGQSATIRYNITDVFSPDGYAIGTFSGNTIILPTGSVSVGTTVYIDYVASVDTVLPTTALTSLPATGNKNQFIVSNNNVGNQPVYNLWSGSTIASNQKFAPTYLRLNVQGIPSRGKISVIGTAFIRIDDIITLTEDGLTVDLNESIKTHLNVSNLPSGTYVSYVANMSRVTLSNSIVSSTDYVFDILNYELLNTDYSNGKAIRNASLSSTQIKLQATQANVANNPTTGEKIQVVYYINIPKQNEVISITSADPQYTKYRYVFVDSVSVVSGFTNLSGNVAGNITITFANQPISGTQYFTSYSYKAPKEGERITVTYLYNRLIADSTLNIENVRPITADVLVKSATKLNLDIAMKVVPTSSFTNNTTNLEQSIGEAITNFVTANGLAATIDASDLINAAYTINGVDRITLTLFNLSGLTGIKKSIVADRNQYFGIGTLTITSETR